MKMFIFGDNGLVTGILLTIFITKCGAFNMRDVVGVCVDGMMCPGEDRCIPAHWICDGDPDCLDKSDEPRGCSGVGCGHHEFECANDNICIPLGWKCDGYPDCSGGTDELQCHLNHTCTKDNGYYMCANQHQCIQLSLVCDGHTDCDEGDDEGGMCEIVCSQMCSQHCQLLPTGPTCVCYDGFILDKDNVTCKDINECESSLCSQICHNTPGSYSCLCVEGYELSSDKTTCTAAGPPPHLLYATKTEIHTLNILSGHTASIHTNQRYAVDLAYDYTDHRIYWTDATRKAVLYADRGGDPVTIIDQGLSTPEGLDVDWVGRHLYIVDSGLKKIIVCSLDGTVCSVLVDTEIDSPRSIVVDPEHGSFYWSDWGKNSKIEVVSMDGSNRGVFVSNVAWPNGLTLDRVAGWLYWVDAGDRGDGRIEAIRLDGTGRKVVLKDEVHHPFSISVFEDRIYWSDWHSTSIKSAHKITGKEVKTLVAKGDEINGLIVYHPAVQIHLSSPCDLAVCSHLCLLSSEQTIGHRCACPVGMVLSDDHRTCVVDYNIPFILVSTGTSLVKYFPSSVGRQSHHPTYTPPDTTISTFDIDIRRRTMYYFDQPRKHLASFVASNSSFHRTILDSDIEHIHGIAVDWLSGNLYWTDYALGSISMMRNDGTSRQDIMKYPGLNPVDIIVIPNKGLLVYADKGTDPHIGKCKLSGLDCVSIIQSDINPHSLFYHKHKIYWSDVDTDLIWSATLDGQRRKVVVRGRTRPMSFGLMDTVFYWTDGNSDKLYTYTVPSDNGGGMLDTLHLGQDLHLMDVKVWDQRLQHFADDYGCLTNNGGCSHFCFTESKHRYICGCPGDIRLGADNKTCIGCPPEQFQCHNTTTCILASWVCDGRNECPDGSDELDNYCPLKTCKSNEWRCDSGRCIPDSWYCDGSPDCEDGEDEHAHCGDIPCNVNTEWKCVDGECLQAVFKCDGLPQCRDGSDEDITVCGGGCSDAEFECPRVYNNVTRVMCAPSTWLCDGEYDCDDDVDETDCVLPTFTTISPETLTSCSSTEFACLSGICIEAHLVCDHYVDCDDGSDEDPNICHFTTDTTTRVPSTSSKATPTGTFYEELPLVKCTDTQYQCNNGECIPLNQTCDGVPHCKDQTDESFQCNLYCWQMTHYCSHDCKATPSGYICACPPGMELVDGYSCKDEDECLRTPGPCSQFCENTEGSYRCVCDAGYRLNTDGVSCKAIGVSADLLISSGNQIFIERRDMSHMTVITSQYDSPIVKLDYMFTRGDLYWINQKGLVEIYSRHTGTVRTLPIPPSTYRGISIDWLGHNIYLTDYTNQVIKVCGMRTEVCVDVVKESAEMPDDIVVQSQTGKMYWSEWCSHPCIKTASMDGAGVRTLVKSRLNRPTALAIDLELERLYWVDAKHHIETTYLDGTDRHVITAYSAEIQLTSLALFEDAIFWNDMKKRTITVANKFSGLDADLLRDEIKHPACVRVRHQVKQPIDNYTETSCSRLACDHVCVPTPLKAVCLCKDGYAPDKGNASKCIKQVAPTLPSAKTDPIPTNVQTLITTTRRSTTTTTTQPVNIQLNRISKQPVDKFTKSTTSREDSAPSSIPPVAERPLYDCKDITCASNVVCLNINETYYQCGCPGGLSGTVKCENKTGIIITYPLIAHTSYAWVAGVLCFLIIFTVITVTVLYCCRKKRRIIDNEMVSIIKFTKGGKIFKSGKNKDKLLGKRAFENPVYCEDDAGGNPHTKLDLGGCGRLVTSPSDDSLASPLIGGKSAQENSDR